MERVKRDKGGSEKRQKKRGSEGERKEMVCGSGVERKRNRETKKGKWTNGRKRDGESEERQKGGREK